MPNFFLVCGISGGGKTILSNKLIAKNNNVKFYDVDEYYAEINGDECIRDNAFEVWNKLFVDLHNSELNNEDVLITTNSLTISQRRQFIEWFPTFDHHILWVTSPLEKCIIGNKSRRRHIPDELLLKQWYLMEFPNAHEDGWKTITHVTNCWDNENYILFKLKGDIESLLKI